MAVLDHPAVPVEKRAGICLESVSFAYNGAMVLEDINLAVREGEMLSLLGPSGSGKTTLLRLAAGVETPLTGRILCKGETVTGPGIDRGMVFQDYSLFPWMDLAQNLVLAIEKSHPSLQRRERRELAEEYLATVGLNGLGSRYPFELSGGMQQRVAIARSLAAGSQFLLMDEPFGALDPINRARLQDLLIEIWARSSPAKTVIFVTHDIDEALYMGDRVVILGSSPGRTIAEVDVDFPRPRAPQAFLKDPRYQAIRGRILEYLRDDVIERLATVDTVKGQGEGI